MQYGMNQNRWSLASGKISVHGQEYRGIQSLSPKESVKREKVYGSGRIAVGRVRGQHEASCSMEMLLSEYNQLVQTLGPSFSDVPFDIAATFIEMVGDGVFSVEVVQATIISAELKASNDQKALVMAVELDVVEPIIWNGLRMCDQEDGFDASGFGLTLSF
jgi:zona occludens toxin (predicted ATPase)